MHEPVLLDEVLEFLNVQPQGQYVDGTLGLGGHAEAILKRLQPGGKLLALDVDSKTMAMAKNRLQPYEDQTITRQVNFRGLQEVLSDLGWNEVDGMIFDLGISSVQLDTPERGFGFQGTGPLDMRMDPRGADTALSILQRLDVDTLIEILREFGEAKQAKRVATYLLHDISEGKIKTTEDLRRFCERVIGGHGKVHPATRVFLALRCLVNDELGGLKILIEEAPKFLKVNGRLAIISFHSLEDRLVKHRMKQCAMEGIEAKKFKVLTKKPCLPTEAEMKRNPRSRSAKLRVLERIQ